MKKTLNKITTAIPDLEPLLLIGVGVIGTMVVLSMGLNSDKNNKILNSTVMITRLTRGGGTGVILKSSKNESQILTNNHVCEAIKDGGIVNTYSGEKHLVSKIAKSSLHDVCMVYVQKDLKVNNKLSDGSPKMYEMATISGHPNLLPTTITRGFFADNRIIDVFSGVTPCTQENIQNPDMAMVCMFFGGIPIIKSFDSRYVTATIMAGSSGSAVYDEAGNIGGLVFAGSGELSYAYTVPYEYVANFVENESKDIEILNYTKDINSLIKEQGKRQSYSTYIVEKCKTALDVNIRKYCDVIVKDLEFRKDW